MLEGGALAAQVSQVRLGGGQLALGLQHVAARGDPRVEAVLGDLQAALIALDRGGQQGGLGVQLTQVEIVGGQRALGGEPRGRQVGGAGLGVGASALHLPADAAPDIRLPAGAQAGAIGVGRLAAGGAHRPARAGDDLAGTAPTAAARARAAAVEGQGREEGGLLLAHQGLGLAIGGFGGDDVLVGDRDLGLQLIERRIAEQGPPVGLERRVGRLGGGPARGVGRLLEGRGGGHRGTHIVGADRAGSQGAGGGGGHQQAAERDLGEGAHGISLSPARVRRQVG